MLFYKGNSNGKTSRIRQIKSNSLGYAFDLNAMEIFLVTHKKRKEKKCRLFDSLCEFVFCKHIHSLYK